MNQFIGPFDVSSTLTGETHNVRFSHIWNAIATRHSDTIDCKFFVDGHGIVVGLAHMGFANFRDAAGRNLTDREASYVAAEYLRGRLQEEDERALYYVPAELMAEIIRRLNIS
jgi:hypothetical protein